MNLFILWTNCQGRPANSCKLKPNGDVYSSSMFAINTWCLILIWTHSSSQISLSPHLIGYAFLGSISLHTCEGKGGNFLFLRWPGLTEFFRLFWAALTMLDCGFVWGISVWAGRISGHRNRGNALTVVRADHRLTVWPDFDWAEFNCFEGYFILLFGGRSWLKLTELLKVKSALLTSIDFSG